MPFFVSATRLSDYEASIAKLSSKLSETEASMARQLAEAEARAFELDKRYMETQSALLEQTAQKSAALVEVELTHRERGRLILELDEARTRAQEIQSELIATLDCAHAAAADARHERDRLVAELREERVRTEAIRSDGVAARNFAEADALDSRRQRDRLALEVQSARALAEAIRSDLLAALRLSDARASEAREERDRVIATHQVESARANATRNDGIAALRQAERAAADWQKKCDDLVAEVIALSKEIQGFKAQQLALGNRRVPAAVPRQISSDSPHKWVLRNSDRLEADTGRAFFIAATPGRSGTQWITRALNRHPEIIVVHAFDFGTKKKLYYRTPTEFMNSVARQARIIAENLDIDAMFDRIDDGQYKVVGNIHGMSVLDESGEVRHATRPYFPSYILRHPVARARSVAARWTYEQSLDPTRHESLIERARRDNDLLASVVGSAARGGISDEHALLLAAIDYVIAMDGPYMRSRVLNVEFERLVGDRDYLKWYVDQLLGGAIAVSPGFVDQMYKVGPVDRRGEIGRYAVEEYQAWPSWIKSFFQHRLGQMGIGDLYAQRGYGL